MTKTSCTFNICPVCSDSGFKKISCIGDFDLIKCKECGLVYITPLPAGHESASIYSEDYYKPWGLNINSQAVKEMKIATFDHKLSIAERYISKGNVLDIGCATGFFLEAAKRRGWDAYGVEISAYSAQIAQNTHGVDKVFKGLLKESAHGDLFFDAVFMSDLLEHVSGLDLFLKEVYRILKVNGIVAIITPNIQSLSRKIMGKSWPHFKIEHLYYFSSSNLRRLLNRYGFSILYAAPAVKAMNLNYILGQISAYPMPVLTKTINIIAKLLPHALSNKKFTLKAGEVFIIAKKAS